jgi:predicted nucleic acid-binding protein
MIYLDTSAFLDLYLRREGIEEIEKVLISAQKPIVMSPLLELEMHSVLGRLVTHKIMTKHNRHEFEQRVLSDIELKYVIRISQDFDQILSRCIEITRKKKYSHRTMDTAHIASAQLLKVDLFVGSDIDQSKLAKEVGLEYKLIRKGYGK